MSESNGKRSYSTRLLLEAYTAIVKASEDTKLPVSSVRSRLALNRNHLKPLIEAIEETRAELVRRLKVRVGENNTVLVVDEDCRSFADRLARTEAFEAEHKVLLDGLVEWAPCATIEWRKIPDDSAVNGNYLATLDEVGILVGDVPPETPPDAKK